jgi:nucleoside phosphorylase
MIHLICALKCEARPLIQHYDLKHNGNTELFNSYLSIGNELTLTITGPGMANAAAGTCYAHDHFNTRSTDAWLNIGVAGHQSIDVGQAVLARLIQKTGTDQVWSPQIEFKPPCQTAELLTLEKPCNNYADRMYDMEAAGFYTAASRYATKGLIHSLKIISDNAAHPAQELSASCVEGLICDRIETVDRLLNELRTLSSGLKAIQETP